MNTLITSLSAIVLLLPMAGIASDDSSDWTRNQLYDPSPSQLEAEARGRVMIYDGFSDREVELVMNDQFNRVQSMMFVGTVVTNPDGAPLVDPVTGEVQTESDGCD